MRITADRPERQPEGLYYRLRRKMVTNAVGTGGGVDNLTATTIISATRPHRKMARVVSDNRARWFRRTETGMTETGAPRDTQP